MSPSATCLCHTYEALCYLLHEALAAALVVADEVSRRAERPLLHAGGPAVGDECRHEGPAHAELEEPPAAHLESRWVKSRWKKSRWGGGCLAGREAARQWGRGGSKAVGARQQQGSGGAAGCHGCL